MFFEVNCDPAKDTFLIREFSIYNEEGASLAKEVLKRTRPPFPNGTYYTGSLVQYTEDERNPVAGFRTFTKSCRLSNGTFVAEIRPSKAVTATGMCGAAEPSVSLSLRKGKRYLTRALVFDISCFEPGVIQSVLINGRKHQLEIIAIYDNLNFPKTFQTGRQTAITRSDIFSKAPDGDLDTQLLLAIKNSRASGDLREVRELIAKGANVNCRALDGQTPLHQAFPEGKNELIEFLISKGADVNAAEDRVGWDPLMLAAKEWREDLIRLFLKHGANVHARNKYGGTALLMTMENGPALGPTFWPDHARAIRALLEGGADLHAANDYGDTIVSRARASQNQALAEWLSELEAEKIK